MNNDFSDLVILVDSREKEQSHITFTNSGVSINTKGVADPQINYSHISDPAESEGFSKFMVDSQPSPADDNSTRGVNKEIIGSNPIHSTSQLSSAECIAELPAGAHEPKDAVSYPNWTTKETKLGTHNTFPVMDVNRHTSIHDTAGKLILTPPQAQPPAVSSNYKIGI